jgi:DDE_Tnp_1-associated
VNYSIKAGQAVEFEVNSLYEALLSLRDQRKARGKRYELATILTLSVLAKLGGEDRPEGMAEWVKQRTEELRGSLRLKQARMPHADAVPPGAGLGGRHRGA